MLRNDQLDEWDRANFFRPSTHLARHARGESASRIIKTASGVHIEELAKAIRDALTRIPKLRPSLDDGTLELDNSADCQAQDPVAA